MFSRKKTKLKNFHSKPWTHNIQTGEISIFSELYITVIGLTNVWFRGFRDLLNVNTLPSTSNLQTYLVVTTLSQPCLFAGKLRARQARVEFVKIVKNSVKNREASLRSPKYCINHAAIIFDGALLRYNDFRKQSSIFAMHYRQIIASRILCPSHTWPRQRPDSRRWACSVNRRDSGQCRGQS